MKKTRFFYSKKILLAILLAWLALLNEAVALNISQERADIEEASKAAKEKNTGNQTKTQEDSTASNTGAIPAETFEGAEKDTGQDTEQTFVPANPLIRVLLTDTDYQTYEHGSVTVRQNGETTTYTPESTVLAEGPVVLEGGESGIEVTSVSRQEGSPVYQGTLEIHKGETGLYLINELPLETYLEAVVPSEMPSSYEKEALMAQAVCARTYAWKQMEEKRLKEYDADVDDSVNYQVYQNIFPKDQTTAAVQETAGQVLCQDGELIEAYYFSTSAGATSTDEIWGAEKAAAYLKSVECTFDSKEPWSKWEVTLPWENVQAKAQALSGGGGALLSLEIVGKNQSGAVTTLKVGTEDGTYKVTEEYAIREFLSPEGCTITERDNSQTVGGKLLPSAYFSMEVRSGDGVYIQGGGYGHGVGMSQNAANQMAKEGYTYEEILDYFFKDVQIEER